jgi:integrase
MLAKREGISARALELLILTAARTGEITGARWAEFDLTAKVWALPAGRMKAKKPHTVPLSDRAVEILKALPREGEFVFPGSREGTGISNMAMTAVMRRMGLGSYTVHGFRSAFRDWASACTRHQREAIELSLAHVLGNKVERAYWRDDMLEKRALLMADWAAYCATEPVAPDANVTQLRATR